LIEKRPERLVIQTKKLMRSRLKRLREIKVRGRHRHLLLQMLIRVNLAILLLAKWPQPLLWLLLHTLCLWALVLLACMVLPK
jgi:hypothetical protein